MAEWFPTVEEEKHCPHGCLGETPLACNACQGVEVPIFKGVLTGEERTEFLNKIAQVKGVLTLERLRHAFLEDSYPDSPELQTLRDFQEFLKVVGADSPGLASADNLESRSNKILGHDDEAINYTLDIFIRNALEEIQGYEDEIRDGQPDVAKYVEWRAKIQAEKK